MHASLEFVISYKLLEPGEGEPNLPNEPRSP